MAFCPNCGAQNEDNYSFCTTCGAPLKKAEPEVRETAPVYNTYTPQPQVPQFVSRIPTGGLLAWSIITLLLCTIPGIVAIVQTAGINKCYTVEEQQKKLQSAKIWCIVGTVLGVLYIIALLAYNASR